MYTTFHIRHQYRSELFDILGIQHDALTPIMLLQRIIEYVGRRGLSHYAERSAWLDMTDSGLQRLFGTDTGERYMIWDDGQRIAGWREVLEMVHERWVVTVPQEDQHGEESAQQREHLYG